VPPPSRSSSSLSNFFINQIWWMTLMDCAAECVGGALARCIRLTFAISLLVPCLLEYLLAYPTC
jgi:hypothetical protein